MAMGTANWGSLPIEILDEMVNRLPGDIKDFIRFGCVCRSWRSVSLENKKKNWDPWMMLSEPEPSHNFLEEETLLLLNTFDEEGGDYKVYTDYDQDLPRKFLNLSTNKTIEFHLPETKGRKCLGSCLGWIFTLGLDLNIHLLNPLTRIQISLPPQPTFQDQYQDHENDPYFEPRNLRKLFVTKFALSSHPNPTPNHNNNKLVVMVIYSEWSKLAFASPGDEAWTTVKSPCPCRAYDDVMFFKDHFYAIQSSTGVVTVCDISTGAVPQAIDFMSPPPHSRMMLGVGWVYYLVELFGDLHTVVRFYFEDDTKIYFVHMTVKFSIYKLDISKKEWIELDDLGNHALFVGNNSAFAISTSDHLGVRSNSVYFTDDNNYLSDLGDSDMGLYDFREKKIVKPFYSGDDISTTFCPPLFFIPSLH